MSSQTQASHFDHIQWRRRSAWVALAALVHLALLYGFIWLQSPLYKSAEVTTTMGLGIEISNGYFTLAIIGSYLVAGFVVISSYLGWRCKPERVFNGVFLTVYAFLIAVVFVGMFAAELLVGCLTGEGVVYLW
ncbi:hypothetical protein [Corynebacterium aquilae]|uniref:Uncharacterized protein n=1 Tax=Corynebacterium aquilae DSM 44791 TaxID=1431546 RepID=A0A1L7CI74_9CORY|nr:hypothetical protein [Corynebacterium aquilae]APT85562.1 hypothetical protein CAQU_11485 [Corynebacterium aquilae DSM 44791]